jgi:16S rRNA (guanine527-N7)-methyltransferase
MTRTRTQSRRESRHSSSLQSPSKPASSARPTSGQREARRPDTRGAVTYCKHAFETLTPDAHQRLSGYLDLLLKWNRVYNLTAIRDRETMETHHLNDALAVLEHLPDKRDLRVLDVGSGGGIPGIPIAIARPDWRVTLVDSNQKKVAFLTQAAIELRLSNVRALATRIEDLRPDESFDIVISRAFSELVTFARFASSHVAPDGMLVAMKGALPRAEIDALPASVHVDATPSLTVPGLDAERHLVIMRVMREGNS